MGSGKEGGGTVEVSQWGTREGEGQRRQGEGRRKGREPTVVGCVGSRQEMAQASAGLGSIFNFDVEQPGNISGEK